MIIINSSTQTAPIYTQLSTSLLGSPSLPIQVEQKHGGKTLLWSTGRPGRSAGLSETPLNPELSFQQTPVPWSSTSQGCTGESPLLGPLPGAVEELAPPDGNVWRHPEARRDKPSVPGRGILPIRGKSRAAARFHPTPPALGRKGQAAPTSEQVVPGPLSPQVLHSVEVFLPVVEVVLEGAVAVITEVPFPHLSSSSAASAPPGSHQTSSPRGRAGGSKTHSTCWKGEQLQLFRVCRVPSSCCSTPGLSPQQPQEPKRSRISARRHKSRHEARGRKFPVSSPARGGRHRGMPDKCCRWMGWQRSPPGNNPALGALTAEHI